MAPRAQAHPTGLVQHVPALEWLPRYERSWLKPDVVAALTLWALLVPQSIAYAQIAGLPPEAGLFATFAGLLGYGLLGTCRQLVVSPTSSTAAISAALVAPLAAGDASAYASTIAMLAILVGIVLAGLGVLRMGFVSRFIAASVTTGFMLGLGMTIIAGQLPKLLGVPGADSDNFLPQARNLIERFTDLNAWTVAVGFGGLAALLILRRVRPQAPAALMLVVGGIALVGLLDLSSAHGVEVIGRLDSSVPLPAVPSVELSAFEALIPGALIIGVLGYAESVTVGQSMADEHDYEVRPDQELLATGFANLLSGVFQGFIVGGGASQSAANDRAGARTLLVSLVVSGLMALTAIALLPLFRDLPQAVLGAIVIAAVTGFINLPAMRRLARLRRDSFWIAVLAMVAVLLLGVLPGLMIAVALSIVLLLVHIARPASSVLVRRPGSQTFVPLEETAATERDASVIVYRLDAPLLFLNAKHLRDEVQRMVVESPVHVRVVVLDLEFAPEMDVGSLNELQSLHKQLSKRETDVWLARVAPNILEMLARDAGPETPEFRLFDRLEHAARALTDETAARPRLRP